MAEKRRKLTAQSVALDGTEYFQQRVPWNELSPNILERIYSFLCRKDQINMSLVCRNWSKGYGMPSVWNEFDFHLSESQLSTSALYYMHFAEKYSEFFRHVRMYTHDFIDVRMWNIWSKRFIYFLDILTRNSQLETVEFVFLGYCLNYADNTSICEAIAEFLASQHGLKKVRFGFCAFNYNDGNRIFQVLAEKQGKSLEYIILRKFFSDSARCEQILEALEEFPRILAFPNLTTLETDYSLVLLYLLACHSNQIQKFEKMETYALSNVKLIYISFLYEHEILSLGLTSYHWKILTTLFPDLQVEIYIQESKLIIENMKFFIKPYMPITYLELIYFRHNCQIEIGTFFKYLRECLTNEYLETLVFRCYCKRIHHFNSFLSFIRNCTKLKCLTLETLEPINAINLMEHLMGNQSQTLKDVIIVDETLRDKSDYPDFQATFNRILPRLRFNLELTDSQYFNHS